MCVRGSIPLVHAQYIMNREEFLKEAQFDYYLNNNSEEIFNLLDFEVKKLVIEDNMTNLCQHYSHEIGFFINNYDNEELQKYYTILIDDGEILDDKVQELLNDEQIYMWHNMVYKSLKDDNDLESWKLYHEKDFILFKSKLRDKQIDSILN